MSRKQYLTKHTSNEQHNAFREAIERLGMGFDNADERRLALIPMDGQPFGARRKELRKPGSVSYSKSYLEARCVGLMLVGLNIDAGVVNVERGDAPDVAVHYDDGRTLYVEHAMVMDSAATAFAAAIDDANIAAETRANDDPVLGSVFANGLLVIRLAQLTEEDVLRRVDSLALADEIAAIATGLKDQIDLGRVDSIEARFLTSARATVFYRPGAARTARPVEITMFFGRREELRPTLYRLLKQKMSAAKGYRNECGPLWLLLSVDMQFGDDLSLSTLGSEVLAELNPEVFDRVLVQEQSKIHVFDRPYTTSAVAL